MPHDAHVATTVIAALVHYGLACHDGAHCVAALRELGHEKAADVLADELARRAMVAAAA